MHWLAGIYYLIRCPFADNGVRFCNIVIQSNIGFGCKRQKPNLQFICNILILCKYNFSIYIFTPPLLKFVKVKRGAFIILDTNIEIWLQNSINKFFHLAPAFIAQI